MVVGVHQAGRLAGHVGQHGHPHQILELRPLPQQHRIAGHPTDLLVEAQVDVEPLAVGRPLRDVGQQPFELVRHLGRLACPDDQVDGQRLPGRPNLGQLTYLVGAQHGHRQRGAILALDQSTLLQQPQRLAHGAAADTQLFGRVGLGEPGTRSQVAVQDGGPQRGPDLLTQRQAIDTCQRHKSRPSIWPELTRRDI